jgi:transcriptional regulator with XRE-family HTH domain
MTGQERLRDALDAALQRNNYRALRELAEEAGVSHATLSNIRNMRKMPSPETLAKLAPFFHQDVDTLLIWAGHRPEPMHEEEIVRRWRTLGLPEDVTDGELVMLGNLLPGLRAGLDALEGRYGIGAGALLASGTREKHQA